LRNPGERAPKFPDFAKLHPGYRFGFSGVDSMRFKTSNQINIKKHRHTGVGLAGILAWRLILETSVASPRIPFALSKIFARRPKGVGKKQGGSAV